MAWTKPPIGTIHPEYVWKNGKFVTWDMLTVHVYGIGQIASSGIYEGIRGYWNAKKNQMYIISLKQHIKRLFNSMKIMQLNIPFSKDVIEDSIIDLIKKNLYKENIYVRPNVFSYITPFKKVSGTPTTWITLIAFPRPSGLDDIHKRKIGVSSWIRPTDQMHPPRVKSIANIANGRLAENEIRASGYEESVQLTINGKVSEMGQGANICLVRDGIILTPNNRESILEGVTKDIVLRIAKQSLKLETNEREIDRTELYIADDVFICGTGHAEITPVTSVDGVLIGDGNPENITMAIRNMYHEIVMGNNPDYMDLLTPVY